MGADPMVVGVLITKDGCSDDPSAGSFATAVPHFPQKAASGFPTAPHEGHVTWGGTKASPHCTQKAAEGWLAWFFEQVHIVRF